MNSSSQFGEKDGGPTIDDLRAEVRRRGWDRLPVGRHLAELALATALAYGGSLLMLLGRGPLAWIAGLLLSAYGIVSMSTQGHTASHGCYTGNKNWDRAITAFCFPVSLGLSGTYWYYKHIRKHHQAPNVYGWDPDIDIKPPFTVIDARYRDASPIHRTFLRVQWAILPVALLFTSFSAQKDGWVHLASEFRRGKASRRAYFDLLFLASHFALFVVAPSFVWGWKAAVGAYLCRMGLVSFGIFSTFAPAHFPSEAVILPPQYRNHDFVERQVRTTLNFRASTWLGRFLCAGVEYQIEHHVLPRLSHTVYAQFSEVMKEFCRAKGYEHRTIGWGEGVLASVKAFYSLKVVQEGIEPTGGPLNLGREEMGVSSSQATGELVRGLLSSLNDAPLSAPMSQR